MKRQRITLGSILEINIDDEYYCYAQILTEADCAFFDFKTEIPIKDFSMLKTADVLFIVAVFDRVITQGHWLKVGKLDIREELKNKPMKFIIDNLNPERYELYDPNTGEITPTTKDKVVGLERAAVWEANHVEDRLRDYYAGKVNRTTERLKSN